MILTEDQRRELQGPEPARAVDPRTNTIYVLLPAELFERLLPFFDEQNCPAGPPPLPPGVQLSKTAFLRDLPSLLAEKKNIRRWVADHGEQCIATGSSQRALIQQCLQRGLREDEYDVGMIVPHAPEPEAVDPSLIGFEETPSR